MSWRDSNTLYDIESHKYHFMSCNFDLVSQNSEMAMVNKIQMMISILIIMT